MRAVTSVLLLPLGLLMATPAAVAVPEAPVAQCVITDPRLSELSGLAADSDHWYAVNDGGTSATVYVVGKDCQVQSEINGPTDPYDVEDLARSADGTFWLSDTGDNDGDRATIALISLTPSGESAVHRLTYPDGPRDAEAVLLDGAGVPYVVTKSPLGTAEVFRPAGPLASPGPTPLELVASVRLSSTDTPGGPVPGAVGSVMVTGGAATEDGSVVALRTYTDAYVFAVEDGDVAAALSTKPVRVPLPNEAQGEAIAFQPDGSLVSASELVGQPVHVVAGARDLVAPPKPSPTPTPPSEPARDTAAAPDSAPADGLPTLPAVAVTIVVVGAIFLLFRLRSVSRRR